MSADTYLMLVDGKVTEVDLGPMLARHRVRVVESRAAVLEEAAGLFADPAFGLDETYEACEAAGMSGAEVNAASYIALVLREAELGA